MAFNKYANGAWQEAETANRYADGAWQECEVAHRHINGAWEEVWVAIKYMSETNYSLPSGAVVGYSSGDEMGKHGGWSIWYFDGNTGGGSVTYYLEGEFVNPTISFDYDGFFMYTPGGNMTYASVGKIDLYSRSTSGAENYISAIDSIQVSEGHKSYSTGFNGILDRVGFRFTFQNWNISASMNPQYLFNIYNIFIDGKECLPSEECVRT